MPIIFASVTEQRNLLYLLLYKLELVNQYSDFRFLLVRRMIFAGKSIAVGDSRKETVSFLPHTLYCSFNYKHLSSNMMNIRSPALIKAECFANLEVFSATATQRA